MTALHTAAANEPGAAESSAAHVAGIKIHYTNYGEGPFAVVFVHGWSCDETVWKEQGPALVAQNIRAITIDLPGHGRSDKPQIAYTQELNARAIAAVLDHAEVKTAVLVGHSLGAAAIRQAYREFPGRVSALVIVDGALRPFGDAAMLEKFIAPLRGADYQQTMARSIDGMTQQIQDLSLRDRIKTTTMATPQHVAVSAMDATMDPALWQPDMIDVPVLMIMARNPRWNADYEQFVRSFIPNLDYDTWDNVSHFLMMEKPREFTAAVVSFMRKHLLLPERS
jgi:pimeloyl-ACP methyl ester carboxylesterase